MYICPNCGALFEESEHYTETHGLDSPPYENWNGCPCCSGTFVETSNCEICNEYITDDYYEVGDMKVCENCCTKKTLDRGL